MHLSRGVGEMVHLELAHRFLDVVARPDQRRDHDQRARLGRHAFPELVADQPRGFQEKQHHRVEEAERALARRHGEQHQKQGDRRTRQADGLERRAGHHHQEHGQQEHRHHDAGPAGGAEGAQQLRSEARPVADRLFQLLAARSDEEEADIVLGRQGGRHRIALPIHGRGLRFL